MRNRSSGSPGVTGLKTIPILTDTGCCCITSPQFSAAVGQPCSLLGPYGRPGWFHSSGSSPSFQVARTFSPGRKNAASRIGTKELACPREFSTKSGIFWEAS